MGADDGGTRRRLSRRPVDRHADGRTAPPQPVSPSTWLLPSPTEADADGVVGIGADLQPATLVDAYRRGIFPWPHPGVPLPWFSPDPRGVIPTDAVHVSRSLRRRLRTCGWQTTVDTNFAQVVAACASSRRDGTWITAAMRSAYVRLHRLGWAHSVEVWDGDRLVGGIYGVQLGAIFTGESMFHHESDASKVALLDLASRFAEAGGALLDVQLTTPHLASLGAVDVERGVFLEWLRERRDEDVRMVRTRRPVAHLAD